MRSKVSRRPVEGEVEGESMVSRRGVGPARALKRRERKGRNLWPPRIGLIAKITKKLKNSIKKIIIRKCAMVLTDITSA